MRMEYRIACHVIRRPDFVEGVRAVIVDKDNAPRWNPATPEGVTKELVESLFAPLPASKEWTPLPELGAKSEEHTSELQSLMRISYAVFCLKNKKLQHQRNTRTRIHQR